MILKAGTYKWNDVLTYQGFDLDDEFSFNFVIGDSTSTAQCTGVDLFASSDDINIEGFTPNFTHPYPYELGRWTDVYGDDIKTFTLLTDQTVNVVGWEDDEEYLNEVIPEFIKFFIANTNYNEVNAKPLAEITYNGETIAQLNAGETCTIKCGPTEDTKYVMASDVVVKVNEVESKIPEGYVKPEGTLELVFNNIEAEFPIDCSQYAKVTVNTAEPLKITDPTVLDNITDSPWGVGGNVFLYEGATTDSYEKDALYYLEDTEK